MACLSSRFPNSHYIIAHSINQIIVFVFFVATISGSDTINNSQALHINFITLICIKNKQKFERRVTYMKMLVGGFKKWLKIYRNRIFTRKKNIFNFTHMKNMKNFFVFSLNEELKSENSQLLLLFEMERKSEPVNVLDKLI